MTDVREKKYLAVNPFAAFAYAFLLGAVCGAIAAFVPTWTILAITGIENASTVSARAVAQKDRQDLNRRVDRRLKDLNSTIVSICKGK